MASFYIRKSGATGWIATIQEYSQGKKKQRSLTDEEYQVFSISRKWAIDEARQRECNSFCVTSSNNVG
jgi:hypothetical protein